MPSLPLPPGGCALSGGELPVTDGTDVLVEFSGVHRQPKAAPVRDAFAGAFAVSHVEYQDASAYAAALCDPTRATGDYLRSLAVEHDVTPGVGEDEEVLRSRLFSAPEIVTPAAIVAAVDSILAPLTTKRSQLFELELDGLFVHDGTPTAWDGFIGAEPRYPDQYYIEDAAENGGFFIDNQHAPPGALISSGLARSFHLRIPALEAIDEDFAFAIDAVDEVMAIGNGSDTSGAESDGSVATSLFRDSLTFEEAYAAIVGNVESIKGQGISWSAYVDPTL